MGRSRARVCAPEAKSIVKATCDSTYLGPPSMKPLRRKSAQAPPSQLLLRKMTQPHVLQFTQRRSSLSGTMNEELWRYESSMHYVWIHFFAVQSKFHFIIPFLSANVIPSFPTSPSTHSPSQTGRFQDRTTHDIEKAQKKSFLQVFVSGSHPLGASCLRIFIFY